MINYPRLSDNRIEKLSDIISDIALISLASVALPAALDRFDVIKLLAGGILSVFFWIISIWLRR
ncbi:MAG: hypothetical protein A2868_03995 [Candidatus Levybacteria bacterium RIFCSPHIGHO2_01_FULL_40_15b]|nr:MAG: hypothetical protein A2868_03995 [Candidatus Levybacteria bacterium RIFCSPHIGHO2_01_FULL_40_15b]